MMLFDKRLAARDIVYSFRFVVVLPDLEEVVFAHESNHYTTYLTKMREAHIQIENLYQKLERPEVTEF
jgi:hypothetical protein